MISLQKLSIYGDMDYESDLHEKYNLVTDEKASVHSQAPPLPIKVKVQTI